MANSPLYNSKTIISLRQKDEVYRLAKPKTGSKLRGFQHDSPEVAAAGAVRQNVPCCDCEPLAIISSISLSEKVKLIDQKRRDRKIRESQVSQCTIHAAAKVKTLH